MREKAKLIAEIGINHNGSLRTCFHMIAKAVESGANFVKFQKRDVDTAYTPEELAAPCESPWGNTVEAKVRGRELSLDAFEKIADYCSSGRIGWSASAFDLKSLRDLEENFGGRMAFHKVPSCMAKHEEFLNEVASYGRLTLVSVGLAESMMEVRKVAMIFEDALCPYVLNVTTALYPTPPERCHLARIPRLQEFRDLSLSDTCQGIGYSGHEVGVLPSVIAGHLGATWIERHFTTDRSLYGADQAASLEPKGFAQLRRDVDQVRILMGCEDVQLVGDEKNPVPNLRGTE